MSDTMIIDRDSAKNNVIPGRLKSIVINERLTISYAGLSTQALDAIRRIHYEAIISTDAVVQQLANSSEHYEDMEFIVCSHHGTSARLIKISGANVYEGSNAYWIGDAQAASELSQVKVQTNPVDNLPDYMSNEEIVFKNAFNTYMREHRSDGIGGGIIDCLCSPYGHCYNTHAGAFSWDTIILGGSNDSEQRMLRNKTGMYHYEFNVCSTSVRGIAVVGFYLPQANIGFIYDPIHYDEAMKIERLGQAEFSHLINDAGKALALKCQIRQSISQI